MPTDVDVAKCNTGVGATTGVVATPTTTATATAAVTRLNQQLTEIDANLFRLWEQRRQVVLQRDVLLEVLGTGAREGATP